MDWNGSASYTVNGTDAGLIACPDAAPADIPFLDDGGQGGRYLAWCNTKNLTIGLVYDPYSLASGLFGWWQSEYPAAVVSTP